MSDMISRPFAAAGLALGLTVGFAGAASAQPNLPVLEDFNAGPANWFGFEGVAPVFPTLNPFGSIDGSAFLSVTDTLGEDFPGVGSDTLLVGIDNLANPSQAASGNAFVGDWLSAGVTALTFDVRHNADTALVFSARLTPPGANSSASLMLSSTGPVAANEWTAVTLPIELVVPAPTPPSTRLADVGSIQLSVFATDADPFLGLPPVGYNVVGDTVTFDFDNIRLVPTPGVAGLAGLVGIGALRRRRA